MHTLGPYQIVEELARGGAGVVYRARRGEHEVALKLLRAGSDATPDQRARFERERQAMARVRHPGIVAIHDAGEHEGLLYLAMDLVTGESLGALLQRVGKLEPRRAAQLALAMADALAAAHAEGILHRDLKPENVLLDEEGRVRLTDFGLARLGGRSSLTHSGHFMGSPGYSAPELATGDTDHIGPATDVYGVGATLYALLTATPPARARPSTS